MSLQANPCNACLKKLEHEGNLNYHSVNDCCWNTMAAVTGENSNTSIRDYENCVDCVNAQIPTVLGFQRSRCNLTPKVPPIWHQAPHYFPDMYRRTRDADGSLNECIIECQSNNLKGECCDNCRTDYMAFEPYNKERVNPTIHAPPRKAEKQHPWMFWLAFILVALATSAILVGAVRAISYPKHYRKA